MNFEECNEKLQQIIKTLEKNELPLEDTTKLFEEGVKLAKKCFEKLKESKGKVTILKNELDELLSDDESGEINF